MHSYNPEQIMLSAAVRRSSRDVNIMKEKLIFSGKEGPHREENWNSCVYCIVCWCLFLWLYPSTLKCLLLLFSCPYLFTTDLMTLDR